MENKGGFKVEFKFDLKENAEKLEQLKKVIQENKNKKGALMPVLHEAQKIFGYLPIEVQRMISEGLNIPLAEIYGVATFYSQFTLIPKGKYEIGVCLGTACYVKGAQDVIDKIKEILDIEVGGTTKNKKFSLQATRCIGACGLAPVMTINDDVYGRLKAEDVPGILKKYMEE
ncbi:complex I 24 kDa subunit family protein [Caldisalinibacter kiritimatiensis]|uniref:NADH-quinone oxidoreductase subunit NuoE family protein n=1 Tax=Caldisalinibacter kiritimatiensis TaxID=1304284 RepID=UPI0006915440